jgi:predicted AlkP superfamily phosphohydrolase/phosphomutase
MSEVVRKVLVVGLDGGDWALIQQWQDQLPTLQRLIRQGVGGRLQATHPPVTSPSWPSFYTGKNPGRFGVFAFRQKQPGSYKERVVNRTSVQAQPVWDLLAQGGKRSIVVNLPVTYPPYPINGVLVTGMLTPATAEVFSWPQEVGSELHSLCQPYIIEANMVAPATDEEREDLIAAYLEAGRKRTRAMRHLLTHRDWDFALVVYRATDVLAHFFWRYMDPQHPGYDPDAPVAFRQALLRAYRAADEGLGELLETVPPETTVVVMSDHGVGPLQGTFAINVWLRERGFLALQRRRPGSLRTFLARRNVTLHSVKRVLDRMGPLKRSYRIVPKTVRNRVIATEWEVTDQGLDWRRTRAFAGTDNGMQIYLNVQGREPQGLVSPGAEYEAVREEIIQALEQDLAARTAPPHTLRVYRREEIYQGPYQDQAPDLLVYLDDGAWEHSRDLHGPAFRPFAPALRKSGSHRPQGMFILSGAGIRPRNGTAAAHIMDLAPTILHLFGLPLPADCDGRSLLEYLSFQREPLYAPATIAGITESGYSPEEEAAVEQHLQDLGYL